MGRRKNGRNISGWLVVDKPAGLTSSAVVNKVRWAFNANKAGHAGTLDPTATGILAIALGEATKTIPFVTDAMKSYQFTVRLGQSTNTDDSEGDILDESTYRPSDDEIVSHLSSFIGDIQQVPPQFSAVKIDGQRAYKRARDGEDLTLAARPLFVEDLRFIARDDVDHVTLELTCGKGGYVRSIARDIGAAIGCYGHVKILRRVWSGPFDLDASVTMETIKNLACTDALDDLLMPLEIGLSDLPQLTCSLESAARLRNGNPAMVISSDAEFGDQAWASCQGKAVAVGVYKAGELHPGRVFVQ